MSDLWHVSLRAPLVQGSMVGSLSNILNSSGIGAEKANGLPDPKFEASRKLFAG